MTSSKVPPSDSTSAKPRASGPGKSARALDEKGLAAVSIYSDPSMHTPKQNFSVSFLGLAHVFFHDSLGKNRCASEGSRWQNPQDSVEETRCSARSNRWRTIRAAFLSKRGGRNSLRARPFNTFPWS